MGWAGAVLLSFVLPHPAVHEHVAIAATNMLAALGQTIAGAVAAYLGYHVGQRHADPPSSSYDDEVPPTRGTTT